MMRVVLLAACSANVVAFLQRHPNQADDTTGVEAHADERPPQQRRADKPQPDVRDVAAEDDVLLEYVQANRSVSLPKERPLHHAR